MADVGNLPVEVSGLVGRGPEVRAGLRLLAHARLVTVTGPAGVGKSRVAIRIAESSRRRLPGGAWYAELSEAAPPGDPAAADPRAALRAAAHAVAAALRGPGGDRPGIRAPGAADGPADRPADVPPDGPLPAFPEWAGEVAGEVTGPLAEAVADAIGDARALVLLDTCEHLGEAAGALVVALLRAAPRLRVVATSRRPLGLPGERVLAVAPLPLDEAVELLRERGQAADPGFTLTTRTLPAARELCRRLDGLPLAIELAAARLRSLTVRELLARLDDRFELLAGVIRTPLARHQGLRAALDWSHELCDPRQRLLWARLSVLSGVFTVADAERACAGGGLPREAVAPALAGLVAASIVVRSGTRHRMLETFRRYGALRLRELGEAGRAGPVPAAAPDLAPSLPSGAEPPSDQLADPARLAPPAIGTLSERQLQVARLISEGLSNPMIAERLAIARRTVDAHVRNILAKAGLTSRAQVATWLAAEYPPASDPESQKTA
ncbi:hypothetical protein GCM10010106_07910 [Thermopolyspora flexuosa]|uniref:Putative ATPase n=1 Tax=Thermopolyspora flexuosa TaxID=103836 RepID=A0A543IZR7_9ACTN|nr:LuxR C-terminal-related transcriptional regulator [Thermopolyspora flexuosa]TQM76064.1 putative ATPase [Thermopolyspora flexuosa]GGM64385.1 hypothetical protein GCM10010106_07910 [Thermopolyspora flexuosa]